jgi:hypothetical protein
MMCPHWQHELTPEQVLSPWGSYCGRRATPRAGPGRPRKKRRAPRRRKPVTQIEEKK